MELLDAMDRAGIPCADPILWDGVIHRYATDPKKRHSKDGWYVAYDDHDGRAAAFGSWREGINETWSNGTGRKLSHAEVETARKQRDDAFKVERDEAATIAARVFGQASPGGASPYLKRKRIGAHGARFVASLSALDAGFDKPWSINAMVIPVTNINGDIRSLQFILADGKKLFMPGGEQRACFYLMGDLSSSAACVVCEGFATGASVREATGLTVAVAFSAGNIKPVIEALKPKVLRLVIGADDDDAGRKAAEGLTAVYPGQGCKDFNDLHAARGLDAIKAVFDGALNARMDAARAGMVTAAQLQEMQFPALRWAVPDLLPEGVTLLGGPPKMGKSWFALNIALAIAEGGMALSKIKVEQGDVLYLALEDNLRRLRRRLEMLDGGGVKGWPDRLTFSVVAPRLDDGLISLLKDWINTAKAPRLIIIDTLARIRPPKPKGDSNQYDQDYAVGQALTALCAEQPIAVVIVCHTRKSRSDDFLEDISGTLGLTGGVDNVFLLRRARGERLGKLMITGRDLDKDHDLAVEFDEESPVWKILGDASDVERSKERNDVLDALRREPLTPKELAEALGIPGATLRKRLQTMVASDEISKGYDGRYRATTH